MAKVGLQRRTPLSAYYQLANRAIATITKNRQTRHSAAINSFGTMAIAVIITQQIPIITRICA